MGNKQQTAVEWVSNQAHELFEQYSEGQFDRITLNKLMLEATEQAKEMEQNQITLAHIDAAIFTEWDILTDARKNADQYYKQTYGGGEQ